MVLKLVRHLAGANAQAIPQTSNTVGCKVTDEELEIAVGEVRYLLIPNHKVVSIRIPYFLFTTLTRPTNKRHAPQHLGIETSTLDGHSAALVLVYRTAPGQTISKSTLQDFHTKFLGHDDVFQLEFYRNVLFYGAEKGDLIFEPDAYEYLACRGTETTYFVASGADLAPGPYVVKGGRAWQPWRIYHDFNSTFMTTFKPSVDGSGGLGQCFYRNALRTSIIK